MNKVILVGRLTKDPEIYYSKGENATAIARYNIAVDRKIRRESEPATDFIPCVLFGRSAEFAQNIPKRNADCYFRTYSNRKLY